MPKHIALIVAGGSGSRMQLEIPKQFLLLNGMPILMHTINQFALCDDRIVVLPEGQIQQWKELCVMHSFLISHHIVIGGATRFHSVLNGLNQIAYNEDTIVSIHDGVRPFVSSDIINRTFIAAQTFGNGVTAIKTKDSIRFLNENGISKHIARENVYQIQTPQSFLLKRVKEAYANVSNPEQFTDDASVVEAFGDNIHLVEGDYKNIKITTPEDLEIAEIFIHKS